MKRKTVVMVDGPLVVIVLAGIDAWLGMVMTGVADAGASPLLTVTVDGMAVTVVVVT